VSSCELVATYSRTEQISKCIVGARFLMSKKGANREREEGRINPVMFN
jgi:hypothetical protein